MPTVNNSGLSGAPCGNLAVASLCSNIPHSTAKHCKETPCSFKNSSKAECLTLSKTNRGTYEVVAHSLLSSEALWMQHTPSAACEPGIALNGLIFQARQNQHPQISRKLADSWQTYNRPEYPKLRSPNNLRAENSRDAGP